MTTSGSGYIVYWCQLITFCIDDDAIIYVYMNLANLRMRGMQLLSKLEIHLDYIDLLVGDAEALGQNLIGDGGDDGRNSDFVNS